MNDCLRFFLLELGRQYPFQVCSNETQEKWYKNNLIYNDIKRSPLLEPLCQISTKLGTIYLWKIEIQDSNEGLYLEVLLKADDNLTLNWLLFCTKPLRCQIFACMNSSRNWDCNSDEWFGPWASCMFIFNVSAININTQVQRYLLFCEGCIFDAHALTLVATKLTPYIGIMLWMLL